MCSTYLKTSVSVHTFIFFLFTIVSCIAITIIKLQHKILSFLLSLQLYNKINKVKSNKKNIQRNSYFVKKLRKATIYFLQLSIDHF